MNKQFYHSSALLISDQANEQLRPSRKRAKSYLRPALRPYLGRYTLLAALLLSGCSPATRSPTPSMQLPASWQGKLPTKERAQDDNLIAWQPISQQEALGAKSSLSPNRDDLLPIFDDPQLKQLLLGANANFENRAARARLKAAAAFDAKERGKQLPSLGAQGAASYNHASSQTPAGQMMALTPGYSANLFDIGLQSLLEIDYLGKLSQARQSAKAKEQAAQEECLAIALTIHAEIASSYVQWCGLDQHKRLLQASIAAYTTTLDLTKQRYHVGILGPLDLLRAQAQLSNTQAQLPLLQWRITQLAHRLDLLLGWAPGRLQSELMVPRQLPTMNFSSDLGIPSDLLRRRPDIRAAEYRLASASSQVEVARLNFFPSFTLTGALGHQSMNAADLGRSNSYYWSFIPGVQLPLFNGGALKAELRLVQAQQEQTLIDYEKSVLMALEEVENALTGLHCLDEVREQLTYSVASLEQAHALTLSQYEQGTVDFLNVLLAQNTLLEGQRSLLQAKIDHSLQQILLYRAIAGNWNH